MLTALFTLDYEIHGNGEGCPYELMVEPTARMLDLFDRYGAKLTIMADVAEILKFRDLKEQTGSDSYHYEAIVRQLKDAIYRGHDVQLHLHCSYFNATHDGSKWVQDWSEYDFASLDEQRMNDVICRGKSFLEEQLCAVDPKYQCNVFRAANWAVSPSQIVIRALLNNDFTIDTSVFKYGQRKGLVNFDYTNAFSNVLPWRAASTDISRRDENGRLVEVPIYSEQRWIGAFLTMQRIYRAWQGRQHPVTPGHRPANKQPSTAATSNPISRLLRLLVHRHAWKADFNQCTGKQLIGAINRVTRLHPHDELSLPFVIIGHSKLFSRRNQRTLEPFLAHIAQQPNHFAFGKFSHVDMPKIPANA